MRPTFLLWHLGLGDAIVCNGLVRVLQPRMGVLVLPVWERNVESVAAEFADLIHENKVRLEVVRSDAHAKTLARGYGRAVVRLGLFSERGFTHTTWDQCFYDQAGVPWDARYGEFHIPECGQCKVDSDAEYAFVHDDIARHMGIPHDRLPKDVPIVRPHRSSGPIFAWMDALTRAKEVHVIDSAFACLADSLDLQAEVKCVHRYARDSVPPSMREGWQILAQ